MSLLEDIAGLESEVTAAIEAADSVDRLKEIQIQYLGRKGPILAVLKSLGALDPEERKAVGARANQLRKDIEARLQAAAERFGETKEQFAFDPTMPGTCPQPGAVHLSLIHI